jgi:hypothetical protein
MCRCSTKLHQISNQVLEYNCYSLLGLCIALPIHIFIYTCHEVPLYLCHILLLCFTNPIFCIQFVSTLIIKYCNYHCIHSVIVSAEVGLFDGAEVRLFDSAVVGLFVGAEVVALVGDFVGATVGAFDGTKVGCWRWSLCGRRRRCFSWSLCRCLPVVLRTLCRCLSWSI